MPIRTLLKHVPSLREADSANVIAAFDAALAKLHLEHRNHPDTLMVAYRIIELAKQGERDPIRLRDAAVKSLSF